MEYFRKLSNGATLVSGMANRLDIDFAERVASQPETDGRSFAQMVFRCAGCKQQGECAQLQADNPLLDEAPAYCRNRDVLHRAS